MTDRAQRATESYVMSTPRPGRNRAAYFAREQRAAIAREQDRDRRREQRRRSSSDNKAAERRHKEDTER